MERHGGSVDGPRLVHKGSTEGACEILLILGSVLCQGGLRAGSMERHRRRHGGPDRKP